MQHARGRGHDAGRTFRGPLGREQDETIEATPREEPECLRERPSPVADQALAVDPGEVAVAYGRAASVSCGCGSPALTPASAFDSARRYARPEASSVSVETP